MADRPAGVFCALCISAIIGYISVVTAPVNVDMAPRSIGLVSGIKMLTREALKSGKIRFSSRINQVSPDLSNNNNNGDLLSADYWNYFLSDLSENSWITCLSAEKTFRKSLSTVRNFKSCVFYHDNPLSWSKLISFLSNIFFKDGVFNNKRPDGENFSHNFIKYVSRILKKFPIYVPEFEFDILSTNQEENQNLLCFIEYSLRFIK